MAQVLGVDAGGSKVLAIVAGEDGRVVGVGHGGSANYQACGVPGATSQIRRAVEQAAEQAQVDLLEFAATCYGVSGADRELDFATIREFCEPIAPCDNFRLENDTIVALRAGTEDGVGIALIAGTGSNAIGRSADGSLHQVGGLGRLTGDYGSAGQLAEAAIVAAFKGLDGRGPATALSQRLPEHLGLEQLTDIIEYEFYGLPRGPLDLGSLAPVVFQVAADGDPVARQVLRRAGREVARAVEVVAERLFPERADPCVVFGGAVFMHGVSPDLVDTVEAEVRKTRPQARFVRLVDPPALGAVAFALADAGFAADGTVQARLRESYAALAAARGLP